MNLSVIKQIMTKKEVNEIRSLYTLEECGISRLAGCYVDGDKNKVTKLDIAFGNLPEDEQHKYFDIFKKALSGTSGKNLLDMDFSVDAFDEQGARSFLYNLRDSELKDEHLLDEFYDRVIETFSYVGHYIILLVNQNYDVPAITTDNIEMEDASDEVYRYLLCCICPVKLSKAGLGYDEQQNTIRDLDRSYMVDFPDTAFLFPAFTDRSEDGNRVLLYSKSADSLQQNFIANVLDCYIPIPASSQKEGFQEVLADTLGEDCAYETILNIHENLNEMIAENKENATGEPVALDKEKMRDLFEKSGVKAEQLERFDESFSKHFENRKEHGVSADASENAFNLNSSNVPEDETVRDNYQDGTVLASNIAIPKKFEIKTPDVVVKINADKTDLVETRMIDGQQYLVIRVDEGLEVNGIAVNNAGMQGEFTKYTM